VDRRVDRLVNLNLHGLQARDRGDYLWTHTRRAIKIVPRHTRPAIVHAHLEVNCSQYALKLRFLHHPRLSSVGVPTTQVPRMYHVPNYASSLAWHELTVPGQQAGARGQGNLSKTPFDGS